MIVRRAILAVLVSAMVAACGANGPDLGALESDLQGLLATPAPGGGGGGGGSAATPDPSASALVPAGGPTAPPAGTVPSGHIQGTLHSLATFHYEGPDGTTDDSREEAVIVVDLVRDPGADGEVYIDAGSTYSMNLTSRAVRPGTACTSIAELQSDPSTYTFASSPTSYENMITASVDRDLGIVLMLISFSYPYEQTHSGCSTSSFSGEQPGAVDCGTVIGLAATLVEGGQADQIDANCSDAGGAVTGTLTLAK